MLSKVFRSVVCSILSCSVTLSLFACGSDSAPSPETTQQLPIETPVTVEPYDSGLESDLGVGSDVGSDGIDTETIGQILIEGSEIGAFYEIGLGGFDIRWTNPADGSYSLLLRTADSVEWNIFYGGHGEDFAAVQYDELSLAGTESLVGFFIQHDQDGRVLHEHSEFSIDLSAVTLATPEQHQINGSGVGAFYEVDSEGIEIGWTNPAFGNYTLNLRTANSLEWDIYHGGHGEDYAAVQFDHFNLSGTETLVGQFNKYSMDRSFVEAYAEFRIELSDVETPEYLAISGKSN